MADLKIYTREVWWQKYYGPLKCRIYALGEYNAVQRREGLDEFSADINGSKIADLSNKFFDGIQIMTFEKAKGRCEVIMTMPNSEGNTSPTLKAIATRLSEVLDVPYHDLMIWREKPKEPRRSQHKKTAEERYKQTSGKLGLRRSLLQSEKRILILDDVVVTGMTALECKKVLIESGAEEVMQFVFGLHDIKKRWQNEIIRH